MIELIVALLSVAGWEAPLTLTVQTETVLRRDADRFFGIDLNFIRDRDSNRPQARPLDDMGVRWLRFPGGEKSNFHLWSKPPFLGPAPRSLGWYASPQGDRMDFDEFVQHARKLHAEPYIVVGYVPKDRAGLSEAEWRQTAAAWVRYSRQKRYGVRYWEIGNENWNGNKAKPAEMARIVAEFAKAMKAEDPSIKVGASGNTAAWWREFLPAASASRRHRADMDRASTDHTQFPRRAGGSRSSPLNNDSSSNSEMNNLTLRVAASLLAAGGIGIPSISSGGSTPPNPIPMKSFPAVLSPSSFNHYVDRFNDEDPADKSEALAIPNSEAWKFMERNIPWFDCPDKQLEETYYYRWWTYRKHLAETPAGWVVTEFLPQVPWAGVFNTISCAAGHHIYEGRWMRDPKYMKDYTQFWLLPEALPRNYSFWAADSVRALTLANADRRLAQELLPNLIANYAAWEKTHRDANGLFKEIDDRDGMEYSLGGSGYRPSINSYMYGDADAIAHMAEDCGERSIAAEFRAKATEIKRLTQAYLWNRDNRFFETAGEAADPAQIRTRNVREEIGFIPWYFNLPDRGYEVAWKELTDPEGFATPYGPTTVERRAKGFMHSENHDCLWNGPSWPYATTQTLVALANLLDNYDQGVVTKETYFDLLRQYSRSQQKDGRPWIAEDLDAETGRWIVDLPRSVDYNHSGFADLVVTGLVGIRPRSDGRLVVKPLVPASAWPWFCLDQVPYHGHLVAVLWDSDGSHYGKGSGLTLFVDGAVAAHRPTLGDLDAPLHKIEMPPIRPASTIWQKYAGGPVLGGKLGTCFDVSLLEDDGVFKMYFSWRPKQSVAVVESVDGIHWGEPRILIAPASTGWEDDINRPAVVKQGGLYHMWYTGQFNGHSSIGFAVSKDGLEWQRREKPVLEAQQPWEKVALMCPSVLWDDKSHQFRMWFSGGEQYEPDAIGYATSPDGIHWTKNAGPIFQADPENRWEQYKDTACQVLLWDGWYYMFYIGFRDIDHAQIGIARSRDGVTHWERMKDNPIISPTVDGWDADACYKPFAIFDKKTNQWMLWYNGRHGAFEQVGLATKPGPSLGFP